MDMPVFVSPAAMADCMGDGPRYFGSNDGCRLITPSFGISKIICGMMRP